MAQPTQERLANQLEKPEQTSGNVGQAGSGTQPEHGPNFQDHEDDHVHHVAMSTYYVVFALLMVLLFITVGAWYIDQHYYPLGALSTPIAMAIAVAKAVAIVLFFMHVKFASKLVQIFACTGVAFVAVMFVLTLQDYTTREWLPRAGVYAAVPAPHIRSSSVGAAPNSQGTPADNMAPAVGTAPATASGGTASNMRGADISIAGNTPPTTNTGRVVGTGGPTSGVVGQRGDSRPGAILGGGANNSFGSEVQSRGIEPKPAVKAPAGASVRPAAPVPATR